MWKILGRGRGARSALLYFRDKCCRGTTPDLRQSLYDCGASILGVLQHCKLSPVPSGAFCFGALAITWGADMEIGAAAASLLIGWLTYGFLLRRMASLGPLPVRLAVLKALPLLFGLMLVPAPDATGRS